MDAQAAPPTQTSTLDPFSKFENPPSSVLIKYAVNAETAEKLCKAGFPRRIRTADEQAKRTANYVAVGEGEGPGVITRINSRNGNTVVDKRLNKHVEVHNVELSMLPWDAESYGFEQMDAYVLEQEPVKADPTPGITVKLEGKEAAPSYTFCIDMRPGKRNGWPSEDARKAALWLLQQPMKFCHIYQNHPANNVTVNAGMLLKWKPNHLKALRLTYPEGKFSLGKPTV